MAVFRCWMPDHDMKPEDGRDVEVADSEYVRADRRAARAAEKYSEWYDPQAAEYPFEREVRVRSPDGSEETFTVEMNMVPDYYARPKRKGT